MQLAWASAVGELRVIPATSDEVAQHADALAAAYNDPANAALLGHTALLTPEDVVEHYATLARERAFGYLLFRDGVLAGDGDVRGITTTPRRHGGGGEAVGEFAFLIASPAAQGRGLGTAFATMIHVDAFRYADLDRLYASIVPANTASRRVFEKLGYAIDTSELAQAFADDGDVVMSIGRDAFLRRHAPAVEQIRRGLR